MNTKEDRIDKSVFGLSAISKGESCVGCCVADSMALELLEYVCHEMG